MANLLLAEDSTHGNAYYMLTGTSDFEYLLDIMVESEMIDSDDKSDYMSTLDGYRLTYKMAGMKTPLEIGDTEAICLLSVTAGGVLCAGLIHDVVTDEPRPWSEWYSTGAFAQAYSS